MQDYLRENDLRLMTGLRLEPDDRLWLGPQPHLHRPSDVLASEAVFEASLSLLPVARI